MLTSPGREPTGRRSPEPRPSRPHDRHSPALRGRETSDHADASSVSDVGGPSSTHANNDALRRSAGPGVAARERGRLSSCTLSGTGEHPSPLVAPTDCTADDGSDRTPDEHPDCTVACMSNDSHDHVHDSPFDAGRDASSKQVRVCRSGRVYDHVSDCCTTDMTEDYRACRCQDLADDRSRVPCHDSGDWQRAAHQACCFDCFCDRVFEHRCHYRRRCMCAYTPRQSAT